MMILYIYCAGGFGKEVMDVARRQNESCNNWSDIKFVDDVLAESEKYGAQVLKFDEIVSAGLLMEGEFVIANGEPAARCVINNRLVAAGASLGRVIDKSTIISSAARVDEGVVITPFCSVSSDAFIGRNASVNTMSIIGHDVRIGENSVVSSMVNIGGGCTIGENSYIGMGALIKEGVQIGSNSIVGMGSVVYNDIPDGMIALGNPARVMRSNTEQKVFK